MATGDVTVSIAVEGGVTKSVVIDSATKDKTKLQITSPQKDLSTDAAWQVYLVNKWAQQLVSNANAQLKSEATFTAKSFTAAS